MNWIKAHKRLTIGIGLIVYALATGIPICLSYGWLDDIRPFILVTDGLAMIFGVIITIGESVCT